eukprot:m.209236 g.209236  ORF g.209236 m.209236 type:complete len:248 (+) comp33031_c1_seq5:189-932(+)
MAGSHVRRRHLTQDFIERSSAQRRPRRLPSHREMEELLRNPSETWPAEHRNREFLTKADLIHGLSMLNVNLIESDGEEYGSQYKLTNMLTPDAKVYCSCKARDVTVILQHKDAMKSFIVTHAVIVAPPSGNFTAPVKDAIVFVSHASLSVADLNKYDGYTRQQYDAMLKNKAEMGLSLTESEPAAYLTVDETSRMAVEKLSIPRTGRFVGIKFLTSLNETNGGNIDVEYIGLKGFLGMKGFSEGTLR